MPTQKKPIISFVVAMANDRVIGKGNQMPWHLPADLKHFKAVTLGKPVVMGRKTHESIGMVLPGRKNIIISRNPNYRSDFHNDQCEVVTSIEAALEMTRNEDEVMIIGGANIYGQLLDKADKLYLTFIDLDTDGDARFPDWTHHLWEEVSRETHQPDEKNPYHYQFVELHRI
ncbi:type 3 dihydrofolate reductase [Kangiella sediminilitoris]|uniref:type 3 dihydrofolate reductase n=1 Tax=Kangiella sediminilitoris TaxID=1144748 RepID=UPI00083D14ED|nr:type 3 dihydrofolate reductase [Kangiella sediminilitoris]